MRIPTLSIRNLLLLTVSTLTLLIVSLMLWEMVMQWERVARIHELKEATTLGDWLFDASEKLSVERDITFFMLHATDPKSVNDLTLRLKDSRRSTDEVMNLVFQSSKLYDLRELTELRKESEAQFLKIQALRKEVDQVIALPQEERNSTVAQRWFEENTQLILKTQTFWMKFIEHFINVDAISTRHMRFKHLMSTIMEHASRERSLVGRLIVQNVTPSAEELTQMLRWQGKIELGWENTIFLAEQSGLFPNILHYFDDAKSQYYALYDMVGDILYEPGSLEKVIYPISIDLWLELSTQSNESFYALKDAVLTETRRHAERLETKAQNAIILHGVVLMLALGLCFCSFRIILFRVLRPIHTMVNALIDATQGRPVAASFPTSQRDDEIGKLAQVLQAFQHNVEQMKHTSERLIHSETRLRAIVDNTVDGLITINERGLIETFNRACERIFGYSAQEVVGKNINILMPEPYHREHDQYLKNYHDTGNKKIIGIGREVKGKRKDGRVFPLDLSVSEMRLADGRIYSGIVRDISARKEAEMNLQRYMQALEHSNKELDDFAYIASHDLKEPLRGLFNNAKFLQEDYQDSLDEEGVKQLQRIGYLSQRMEVLVNDLLYFSRLGRQDLAIQKTDLEKVIEDIKSMMESTLKEENVTITIPKALPIITCDKLRITEVFRNLITNAVKYNDNKVKTIEIGHLAEVQVPEGTERDVFYVKDNGIGIEREFFDEVFRIFKRLNEEDDSKKGTGVGLTFVKKIIERHGGRVWLTSEIGKGTTFYFTIKQGVSHGTTQ